MPRRHVSRDLKERIPYLRYIEGFKVKEIERILGIKKSMIYQTLNYHRNYGVAFNPMAFSSFSRGRPRILTSTDLNLIKALLGQEPTMYLDELQDELLTRRGAVVSIPTLLRSLRRLHFSRKSVSIHALERNDLDHSIYMNQFAEMVSDPAMVMFVDEAAKNTKNPSRKIGWSLKGQCVVQRRCFIYGQRFSILPVLTLDGIIAHDVIPGWRSLLCPHIPHGIHMESIKFRWIPHGFHPFHIIFFG
jgi:transposase